MNDNTENVDAPDACEELMENFILIEDEAELEPEEEPEDQAIRRRREAAEQLFARFERNYRSRRIRELTLTPFKKKGRRSRTRHTLV